MSTMEPNPAVAINNEAILSAISKDRALGSAMLFPHRHRHESAPFHITVMDLWACADELVSIEAFRQGAKTALSEEFLLMEGAFKNFNYCLIFGETYTKACQRIEAMKHEILMNPKLKALFGNLKGSSWSENKIVLSNGVAIEAHGWEEEIRGYKHLDFRPDRAYLDDIETRESVRSKEAVDAGWKKIHMELIPAMDSEYGKIRMTGTPLADDCLIRRAALSENWTSAKFAICDRDPDDPEAQSLWPSRYPIEWIRKKKKQMADEGMLTAFNQEYMLIPMGAFGKPFEESMIHFEAVAPVRYAPKVAIIDPARSVKSDSDQTGSVVVSKIGHRIYIHESDAEYLLPDGVVDLAFNLSHKYDDCESAVEKNSLDEWLLQPIRAKALQIGRSLPLRVLQAPQDRAKEQFIMGLQPYFKSGDIVFVGGRSQHAKLISQILNFPSGKRDALNALAYVQQVFSGVAVYGDFGEANISEGVDIGRNAALLLMCNASGAETTAVLVALEGSYLTVLNDWISPLMPTEVIPDIASFLRAVYPGRPVAAWVPAEIMDQVGRNPLVQALKSARISCSRGEYSGLSRQSLSTLLRTEVGGRRRLKVSSAASHTLQAFAAGYSWPLKPTGERQAEPLRSPARTLMEGLEVLTFATNRIENSNNGITTNAMSANGVPYHSALGAPRGR